MKRVAIGQVARTNQGAPNGPSRGAPFNRWFRYPAGFAADLRGPLTDGIGDKPCMIIDPFLGTATLGPWLASNGHRLVGVEANPLVAEVAALKLHEWPEPGELRMAASRVTKSAKAWSGEAVLSDEHSVVLRCFEPGTLQDLVALREAVGRAHKHKPWLVIALAATLRDVSSSSVAFPYQRPGKTKKPRHGDAHARFAVRLGWMADDIESIRSRAVGRALTGDSRIPNSLEDATGGGQADACVTSPPYLNNYDYADATRLEMYFLGRADSWSSMCRYARDGMIVASTQQTGLKHAISAESDLECTAIGDEVAGLLSAIRLEQAERTRPKEYDRLLVQYLNDMGRVLTSLRAQLVDGAPVTMAIADSALYGVHVDTPRIVGELAEGLGYLSKSRIKYRQRGMRWNNNPQRTTLDLGEYVLTLVAD